MPERARHATRRHWALPSWLLSQAALAGSRITGEHFGARGLGRHGYSTLVALAEHGPSSQAELGRIVALDRSDLHAVVADLEARGAVARERDPDDRRRNVVTLTSSGRRLLAELDTAVDAAQDELLAALSARERAQLTKLLTKLLEAQP